MGKTHIVSPSELSTFQQCPLKHELAYKQRWTKETTAPALVKGTRWHEVLELHYNVLRDHQLQLRLHTHPEADVLEAAKAAVLALLDLDDEVDEIVWWMYQGHVETYGADTQWKILAVEHRAEAWLPTERGGRSNFKLKMKIDLIVRDLTTGGIWIVDHKSGRDLPKDRELDLDDQFGLYEWGIRQLGHKVIGTVYNAARTHRNKDQKRFPQPLDERFRRVRMSRSDKELDTIAVEAYRTFRTAYRYAEGEAPRATNTDTCRWKCDYTDACLLSRKGVDQRETLVDFGFRQDFTRH